MMVTGKEIRKMLQKTNYRRAEDEALRLLREAGVTEPPVNPEQEQDFREKEANAFAANLLIPRFMMDRYWESISQSGLSQLFAVSVPAIKARLSFLYGV
jgi:Zn-dependent peptidase ImmA (M78 family)